MHCDHSLTEQYLFDYLDGKLSPEVKKQVADQIERCSECQSVYQQAVAMTETSHRWIDESVPEWHRTRYLVRPQPRQNLWLSWGAMATSALAILMVIFNVQINTSDQGITLSFGSSQNEAQIEQLVQQKLNAYAQKQNQQLDEKLKVAFRTQSDANKLLLADWLEKSREERRDDLNFLITGLQTQRLEDQQKLDKRLTYLAQNQIENNQYINQLIQSANQ